MLWLVVIAGVLARTRAAAAQDHGDGHEHHEPSVPAREAQLGFEVPRETLIPGRPGMAGGYHVMINGWAELQNVGLGGHVIANPGGGDHAGGVTKPLVVGDWAMIYGRHARGWVEGLLMLNFEPLTVGAAGVPEVGQSGEGLWDAQHSHLLVHQAMAAFHPLAATVRGGLDGDLDLSIFAGQGSATIGPPIFMHRASSPGPTVPRKHHKGENPHETAPVIGVAVRVQRLWLEASVFGAQELGPEDSRFYPHPSPPRSFAARVRYDVGDWLEAQISAERLTDQDSGVHDAVQGSASGYAWGTARGWRLDGLVDYAFDRPDGGDPVHALNVEAAARSASGRDVVWLRSEVNQREERDERVTSPWLVETAGYERIVAVSAASGLQVGIFAEGTWIHIPAALQGVYGRDSAVTINVGLHLFGMWMLDGSFRRVRHAQHSQHAP